MRSKDLLKGTLDLLVLRTLSIEPMHGWGIAERIREMSGEELSINDGSLYPALQRLKSRGWVHARWDTSENNRRARYYELTDAGRLQLREQREAWRRSAAAIDRVLDYAWEDR